MKMYISVLNDVPDFIVPTLVAHAVLGYHIDNFEESFEEYAYLNKNPKFYPNLYHAWLKDSFKKCVVRVNQKEFDKISLLPDVGLFHENKTLEGKKSCAVLVVDEDIPNVLKYAKLWSPSGNH